MKSKIKGTADVTRFGVNAYEVPLSPITKTYPEFEFFEENKFQRRFISKEFVRRIRIFLTLIYYFAIIRLRKKCLVFLEIIFPIIIMAILTSEILNLPKTVIENTLFTSSLNRSTENGKTEKNFLLCPFGTYGLFGEMEDTSFQKNEKLGASAPSNYAEYFANLLCDPKNINESPFLRPVYHFSRTLDRKYLTYIPTLMYLYGSVIFSDPKPLSQNTLTPDASSCQKMREFFDNYLIHINPYFAVARQSIFLQNSLSESLSYWAEAYDIGALLESKTPSLENSSLARFIPLLENNHELINLVRNQIIKYKCSGSNGPVCEDITYHFFSDEDYQLSDELLQQTNPHALIYCDRQTSISQNVANNFGSLSFTVRMNVRRNAVVATDRSSILHEGNLITYDGSYTSTYHFGKQFPNKHSCGGFLSFQNLIYSHVFNATKAAPLDSVKAVHYHDTLHLKLQSMTKLHEEQNQLNKNKIKSDKSYLNHEVNQRLTLFNNDSAHLNNSNAEDITNPLLLIQHLANPQDNNKEANISENLKTSEQQYLKLRRLQVDGCHTECVEFHLSGETYCNPACNYIYTTLNFKPSISFKDSRSIFNIFLECGYAKITDSQLDGCVLALFQSSCNACSKTAAYKIKELYTLINEAIVVLADNTNAKNESREVEFFERILNIINQQVDPNDTADIADVVYCFSTIAWLSSLTTGTNFITEKFSLNLLTEVHQILSLIVQRNNLEAPIFFRPLLDSYANYIFIHKCSLLDAAILYNNLLTTNENQLSSVDASNTAQVLNNLYIMMKSKPVVDQFIPVRFTETAFPIKSNKMMQFGQFLVDSGIMGFAWCGAYILIYYNVIRMIVADNKPKIQETLRTMNVPKSVLWSSIYFFYCIYFFLLSLVLALMASLVYESSSYFFVFIVHFSFSISLISVGFFFSSLMCSSSPSGAANVGLIFYMLSMILEISTQTSGVESTGAQYIRMLFPPSTFFRGHTILFSSELSVPLDSQLTGTTFTRLHTYEGNSVLTVVLFLLLDSIIYMLLALYLSEFIPSVYGHSQPWYFPFQITYWSPQWKGLNKLQKKKKLSDSNCETTIKDLSEEKFEANGMDVADFSQTEQGYWAILPDGKVVYDEPSYVSQLKPFIVADNIGKMYTSTWCFKKEEFWAVSQSSFKVYPGEVFALLGHNGAGKTTILSLLTGMIALSEGSVQILGQDIIKQANSIRSKIGFVPQYSFFFPELTVKEHLRLFCVVKCIPKREIEAKIKKILKKVNIIHKINSKAKVLSGGQKRALSIAIATVGDPAILFLDEPSTGMDPHTRRYFWQTIRELRRNKAIILTTHFLEEADRISDTIGILSSSRLRCFGSSYFLKQVYGAGYTCVILKTKKFDSNHLKLLLTALQGSTVVSNVCQEIVLHIPFTFSENIPNALRLFETVPKHFGIKHFSIKLTTLETVFFNVVSCEKETTTKFKPKKLQCNFCLLGEQESLTAIEKASLQRTEIILETNNNNLDDETETQTTSKESKPSEEEEIFRQVFKSKEKKCWLFAQFTIMIAMFQKNWWKSKRNIFGLFLQFAIPIVLVAGGIGTSTYLVGRTNRRVVLDGSELKNYSYKTFVPSTVLIGSSRAIGNTLLSSSEAAEALNTCIADSYDGNYKPQKIQESFSNVTDFDESLLKTWSGEHLENDTLTSLFGSPIPRTLAFFMDSSMSFEKEKANLISKGLFQWPEEIKQLTINNVFPTSMPKPIAEGWLFHNGTDKHAIATGYNMFVSCILKRLKPNIPVIKIANYPFSSFRIIVDSTVLIVYGVAVLGGFWVNKLTREKQVGAKKSQHDAGITFAQYWLCTEFIDILYTEIMVLLIFGILNIFNDELTKNGRNLLCLTWMAVCGLAYVPFTYLLVFYLNEPMVAQFTVTALGLVIPILHKTLSLLPKTQKFYSNFLVYIFRLIPTGVLLEGLEKIFDWNEGRDINVWSYQNLGGLMYYVWFEFFGYSILIQVLEVIHLRSVNKKKKPERIIDWHDFVTPIEKTKQNDGNAQLKFKTARPESFSSLDSEIDKEINIEKPLSTRVRSNSLPSKGDEKVKEKKTWRFCLLNDHTYKFEPNVFEDSDVSKEREKIKRLVQDRFTIKSAKSIVDIPDKNEDVLLTIEGLTKVFGSSVNCRRNNRKVAVENIWFGVSKGQIFGVVGGNGAGKTTTMQMITGRSRPTVGRTCIGNVDISNVNFKSTDMGYCPQFDTCFDELTGREHLLFYLRIAMVPSKLLKPLSDKIIEAVDLGQSADKVVRKYSCGNRRKLALALTFIHNPRVVILDEPSSGIDPMSRRKLWKTIIRYAKVHQSATIITSHSMEECEALCDRIGIIQDGRLVCIGTPEHLRSRFAEAYQLEIAVNRIEKQVDIHEDKMSCVTEAYLRSIDKAVNRFSTEFIDEYFPDAILIESVGLHQRWSIPKSTTTLSELFFLCEKFVKLGLLKTYGVNEVSLEDVYLNFSKANSMAKKNKL